MCRQTKNLYIQSLDLNFVFLANSPALPDSTKLTKSMKISLAKTNLLQLKSYSELGKNTTIFAHPINLCITKQQFHCWIVNAVVTFEELKKTLYKTFCVTNLVAFPLETTFSRGVEWTSLWSALDTDASSNVALN